MRELWSYYRPYRGTLVLVIVGSLVGAGLEISFPMLIRHILEEILPQGDMAGLAQWAGILLGLYLLCMSVNYFVTYHGRSMGVAIEHDLRCKLFVHIEGLGFRFFDNTPVGQLVSRLISDIAEIGDIIFQLPNLLIVCSVMLLGSAGLLFYINWQLAFCLLAIVTIKTLDTLILNRRMKDAFRQAREKTGQLSGRATEILQAIRLVKAFGNELFAMEHFRAASRELQTAQKRTFRYEAYLMSTIVFFSNVANLVIIALGAYFIIQGRMSMGDLVAFILYLMLFLRPVMQLTMLTERYQRSMAGFNRCRKIFQQMPEAGNLPASKTLGKVQGRVTFEHVSFAYENKKQVLQDFNLEIAPGETVAVVGPTGVGKSTLASLLLRFYEPGSGRILLDGVPLQTYTLHSLRQAIGLVQQDVVLFDVSVRENIAFGSPGASNAEIEAAARQADADDFIRRLPQGYESRVGERGVKLSGGQKQRIAIARIFLKNPPILILDEATSALDNKSEQKVQQALQELAYHRTTLIIAHRLSTIRQADRIIVLTADGIAETGNHEELMHQHGVYYRLYMSQFTRKNHDMRQENQ